MITTKGGYAIADLTFVTAAEFATVFGGTPINISKSQFDQISRAFMSGKPTKIAYFSPTIPNIVNYMECTLCQETITDDYLFEYSTLVFLDPMLTGTLTEFNVSAAKTIQSSGEIDYTLSASVIS